MADQAKVEEQDKQLIPEAIGHAQHLANPAGTSRWSVAAGGGARARNRNMMPAEPPIAAPAANIRRLKRF
jgi:hypothetical protein